MDNAENKSAPLTDELRDRAEQLASDFTERATEYYDEAQTWLSENQSKVLVAVGVLAAVGIAGYWVAKKDHSLARRNRAAR
jgi:hypothetical protein